MHLQEMLFVYEIFNMQETEMRKWFEQNWSRLEISIEVYF